MPTAAEQIDAILLSGKRAKTKEEQDKIIKMLSALSVDYSNAEYPKMTASEFASGDAEKAALSPQEMLKSYYGENLSREIIAAGNYNIARPTLLSKSYQNIFDTIPVSKTTKYGSSYSPDNNGKPMVELSSGRSFQIGQKNDETYRKWLQGDDPELKARALKYFQTNSLDPSIAASNKQSSLEHEIGHHITRGERYADLPLFAKDFASIASDEFDKFGGHTSIENETTQALGRFQREMFKNTGKRLHPVDFMELVNKGEIPDFLTQEGRRILIYAKNLKEVADKSKDKKKKEAAREALWNISRMAPAVVQNKKQYGLNLKIG
jgi:hypothetical protein